MRRLSEYLLIGLLALLFPPCARAQTINTVPSAGASFMTDLQTFLQNEDADRHEELFTPSVVSGGIHGTAAGLSGTPSAMTAYPGGHRAVEPGTTSITYSDDSTCWVIAHKDTTGDVGAFTRVSGSHFLSQCGSPTQPTLPADSVYLMKVVTASGAITDVDDLRVLSPVSLSLPAAGLIMATWLPTATVDNSLNGDARYVAPLADSSDCATPTAGCYLVMPRTCVLKDLWGRLVLGTTASEALTVSLHTAATPDALTDTASCSCQIAAGGAVSCSDACSTPVTVTAGEVVAIGYKCDGADCPYDLGPLSISAVCE